MPAARIFLEALRGVSRGRWNREIGSDRISRCDSMPLRATEADTMSRTHRLPLTALILIIAVPLAWLACGGGESKPPESPASESSAAASSEAPDSEAASAAASASSAPAADTSSATSPSADAPASSPPPAPSLGSTDCGKCIDKTCSKQEAACGKNTDCQSTLDSIHGCSSGAASCVDSATQPSTAKPKKLATAFEACAKRAAAKACKAKCQ